MRALLIHRSIVIVTAYMVGRIIISKMILDSSPCLRQGELLILIITGQASAIKQQVQVHHMVYDNGKIPLPEVPGTDTAYLRIETAAQVVRCSYHCTADAVGRT